MFVPNPDKTTWPPAFSKWRPKDAAVEDPVVSEDYPGLTPSADQRTVLAVVQGRGSAAGLLVYYFEVESTTGGVAACVMPLAEWSATMRRVGDPPQASHTQDDYMDDLI